MACKHASNHSRGVNMFASTLKALVGEPATGRNVCDVAAPLSGVKTMVNPLTVTVPVMVASVAVARPATVPPVVLIH